MEYTEDSDVPLPTKTDNKKLNICIVFNLKSGDEKLQDDCEAEYDGIETVNAIKAVFEKQGHTVTLLCEDKCFAENIKKINPDFVFNIAEGIGKRGREAEVPAILDMLGIPYSGSDSTTLAVALDKALTKKLLSAYRIKTPRYVVAKPGVKTSFRAISYPVIVKPNAEGSSKGVREKCVVNSRKELTALLTRNFESYGEDMLVEEYIKGREFTVAVLGNGKDKKVFEPMEISFKHPTKDNYTVYSFDVKKEYKKHIEYKCPSDISQEIKDKMVKYTSMIYDALGCRDFGRVDYRVSESGEVCFIEINPLPGLAPDYSDFPMIAGYCGISYDDIVASVLNCALKRCGLM